MGSRGCLALGFGLVGLVACRFDTGGAAAPNGQDAGPAFDADPFAPDADPNEPDADPNAPDAGPCDWTYTPAHFDPCGAGAPEPDGPIVLSSPGTYVFDTDTGVLTDSDDDVVATPVSTDVGGAHAIWVSGLIVASPVTLRVEGSKPLLVVSDGDIDVFGVVDASSFYDADSEVYVPGAGADPSVCPATPPEEGRTCAQHAGSGGGAGAFGGRGGAGGEGGDGRDCGGPFPEGIPGGAGGISVAATPSTIRGGCGGRDGAPNNSAGSEAFGVGGPGGGAVHLAARDAVTVSGTVHAGGGGGGPGTGDRSGGGGGGSGGLIGLEGATVQLTSSAVVAANGGGGGGGCDNGEATPGEDGQPGAARASGGAGEGNGEAGGAGGAGSGPDGVDAIIANRGGGGGGGGAGYVILYGPGSPLINAGAVVSPGAIVK